MGIGRNIWPGLLALVVAVTVASAPAFAQQPPKPNILVIMGDDIGYWNISAYNRGMMGYRTPNIDRIANEGARKAAISCGVAHPKGSEHETVHSLVRYQPPCSTLDIAGASGFARNAPYRLCAGRDRTAGRRAAFVE